MSLKKKRVRKSIALVLVGVMVVTPVMNNVSAMENTYVNSHIEIQENIEYFKNVETYIIYNSGIKLVNTKLWAPKKNNMFGGSVILGVIKLRLSF